MIRSEKLKLEKKTRQNVGKKPNFDLTGKIEIEEKIRQNTENKLFRKIPMSARLY